MKRFLMTRKYFMLMMCVMAATFVLAIAPSANAVPVLTISDGTTTISVQDGDLNDQAAAAGAVSFSTSIGAWTVSVSTGLTKPNQGTADEPVMHLNVVGSSSQSGVLTVTFFEDGFTGGLGGVFSAGGYNAKAGTLDVGKSDGYAYENGSLIGQLGTFGAGAYSDDTNVGVGSSIPYSLMLKSVFTHTGAGASSTDLDLQVPEPGSLLLFGSGLVGLAIAIRKKKKLLA